METAQQFLVNLIQNSFESINKSHYQDYQKLNLERLDSYCIKILPNSNEGSIAIIDSGIGLNKNELGKLVNDIYSTFTTTNLQRENEGEIDNSNEADNEIKNNTFFPLFVVCDKLLIITKTQEGKALMTELSIQQHSEIKEYAEDMERGTAFILQIKEQYKNVLSHEYLKETIQKKCQMVVHPISLLSNNNEISNFKSNMIEKNSQSFHQINRVIPIWHKNYKEITEEEYQKVYGSITQDSDQYFGAQIYKVEGSFELRMIIYISYDNLKNTNNNKRIFYLYNNKLLMNKKNFQLPKYLNYVCGVIGHEDSPIDPETKWDRCNNIYTKYCRRNIHVIFEKMIKNDEEKYLKFYQSNSINIKLGLLNDQVYSKKFQKLLRYYSSYNTEKMISLQSYINRSIKNQNPEIIYYIIGESLESLKKNNLIAKYNEKNIEILFMTDDIDNEILKVMTEFEKYKFQNISQDEK
ncbi:endoplasmin [Anaeramoeba flamelloides]|uniref:Endoplasmin n=1 Tax=Anaeramoeba flamelloides TaxID=1746091 RepID=A0AAV7YP53_9EUKA|nr:endoplasmin [Anaeramoeba flamelloides]